MKNLRNLIVCLFVMFLAAGCTIEYDRPPPHGTVAYYAPSSDFYICEDPYWFEPDWCEYYDDGSTCCTWYVDGWYEEYCWWSDDWCWEYNGSW